MFILKFNWGYELQFMGYGSKYFYNHPQEWATSVKQFATSYSEWLPTEPEVNMADMGDF